MSYRIERYQGGRDEEVAAMVLAIQNDEYGLELTIADQPDLEDIVRAYGEGGFWTALGDEGDVIGTIGLLRYGPHQAALKKFFIPAAHRGSNGPAKALFDHLMAFARDQDIHDIFLDTPAAATRSHSFYRKVGFEEIDRAELPAGYKFPDRGSVIFRLKL